ncbi:MAG: VOC family protein [Streptomyces sp.]|jgi:predicted enzyme related to lactoylglutathione lyase|nr:VOC family protein [Streptomyces sp.]
MYSTVTNVAVDCTNAYQLALFWSQVTGHPLDPEDGPGEDETEIMLPGGLALHFNEVPEPKAGKNRLHLCLRPDTSRDAEVERLLALGASLVADQRKPNGYGWVVLADPEGNEFCILCSESERAALPPLPPMHS